MLVGCGLRKDAVKIRKMLFVAIWIKNLFDQSMTFMGAQRTVIAICASKGNEAELLGKTRWKVIFF